MMVVPMMVKSLLVGPVIRARVCVKMGMTHTFSAENLEVSKKRFIFATIMYCIITMYTTKPYNYKPNGDMIMKKLEPLRNLKLTAGRYLLMIFALTMLPMGTWAEDYGLTVAGVAVTSDNASNVLGDEIVSVSYNNATNTLTLRGAYISGSNITVDEGISALTLHLVGQSCIYPNNDDDPAINFANDNPSLTITTSETLPGSLVATILSNVTTPVYSNGLSYNDGIVSVSSLANTELVIFTGKDSDTYTDNGDNSYIYSGGKEFYASYAVGLNKDNKYAQVQTKENETTATMWPSSYDYPQLQKVILQIGACTAADVTVQVKGMTEDQGSWVSDGTTYSEPIALSTANADGILEIPLENFSSKNVQLVFSSASSFSFIPITIAFVSYQNYNIAIGGIAVTEKNAANITGNGITGSVSYDNETHTLTLNNATIVPEYEAPGIDYSNDENLTIALIGDNTVQGLYGCEAIRYNGQADTPPYVYFVKGDANHFSLVLVAGLKKDFIGGFRTNNEGLFFTEEEGNDTHSETISSSMFGGTGSADEPFLIKTADDLKNFAINYNEGRFSNNVHIQLFNDINCEGLTGFTPIADNSGASFCGVFDGNNKTISNLDFDGTRDNASYTGLFGIIDETAVIKNLTLSNCNFSGGEYAGAIVAYLQSGTIQDCNVTGCSVETRNAQYPNAGGVAGYIYDGTIQRCNVTGSTVNGTTTYTVEGGVASTGGIAGIIYGGTISACEVENTAITSSHALPIDYQPAGGIVGNCYFGGESATTVSGNAVKGTTTVSSIDNNPDSEGGHTLVGAIVGFYRSATLSNNTYEYTVTVSTRKQADNAATTTAGYTHRGLGGSVEFDNDNYPEFTAGLTDLADNNGAVMYTQTVTVPAETEQATVTAEEYYTLVELDNETFGYAVAPGQTVTLNANPGNGYAIASLTATNTTTSAAITTTPTSLKDGIKQYTFTMPDAPVTVAVTAVAAYGVTVAGVEVTELNYTDVLGDGKVSFTLPTQAVEPQTESTPATLTLNGATINGNIVSSLTTDLYIHLLGSNVINAGEKSAFVSTTASSTQTLVFTTNATTPGQLLIKTSSNGYKENFSDAFGDGLTLADASGKMLIAAAPTMTPTEGLYWTDQQFTVSGPSGSTLYYKNKINSEETAYTEPFTLAAGNYRLCAMRKVTVDETEFSLYGSSIGYVVHAKPAFSPQAGTYVGQQEITLTNLPSNLGISSPYPQVWYYLGENVNDSVNISSAEQAIAVSESTKVTVYILDEDSGKVYKSAKVEAEYTILSDMAEAYVEEVADATYTGSAIVPTVVVRANEKSEDNLTAGEDYTVSYMQGNNSVDEMINAGDYSIVITGKGAYGGSQQVAFTITKAQAEVTTAPVAANELAYTGEAQNLLSAAGVANFGTVVYSLASNGEFTATIPQATEVGDYEVFYKVLGTDNYDGTDAQSVAVTISKAVVTLAAANQSTTYTGAPVTYDVSKITITPAALAEDRAISYTVSYNVPDPQNPEQTALTEDAPTAVGTYGVTISLVDEGGRYQAEAAQATLTITAAAATLAVAPQAQQNLVFNATPQELVTAGQTADGTIQYKLSTDENWSTAIPTATNKGTYTVSYKVVGDANHNDTEPVDVEVTISAMTLTSEIVSLNQTGTAAIVYDGEAKTPAVAGYYSTQKTELVEGTDFTVAYTDNTNAGTAKATVTGLGNYTGSVELTFTIGKADFAGVEIAEIADQPYNNGQAIEPAVTVTFNGIEVPASEYSVAYTANTAVGKATVTLTATGQTNFVAGGTASTTFTIINRTLAVGTDVAFADGQTWASYYTTTESLTLPEGVMAYIVTAVSETAATVAPISYVPKDVPVLLENNSTVTTENTDARGNLLAGTTETTAVAGLSGTVYGLHGNRFLKVTSGSIPAHRAYLVTGTEVVAPTGAPYLNIIFGDATAIDRVKADAGDGQWYTLDGRKLQQKPAKKGLYIKNGRKVVINNK